MSRFSRVISWVNGFNCKTLIAVSVATSIWAAVPAAQAHIYQWIYFNPLEPGYKVPSNIVCPGGAGVNAVPGANLNNRNLTKAYLIAADLTNANLRFANVTDADFSEAMLTGADLTGSIVRGARFFYDINGTGTGITAAQLYSTASYVAHDLTRIDLGGNDLTGIMLSEQNLTNAVFDRAILINANLSSANLTNALFSYPGASYVSQANLTGANLQQANLTDSNLNYTTLTGASMMGALVRGANFYRNRFDPIRGGSGITLDQLYSTASYVAHDLTGINLGGHELTGANFSNQNLSNAQFESATLSGVVFTNADVRGASFYSTSGFTTGQLYSTASYVSHDLTGINLSSTNLSDANFVGQNLTNVRFLYTTLTNADFSQANLTNTGFPLADLTGARFGAANLSNLNFSGAILTDTTFDGAVITGANFGRYSSYSGTGTGITVSQLSSTASYQSHDLIGIELDSNNLTGGDFSGQNFTDARLDRATFTNGDFSNANLTNTSLGTAILINAKFNQANITNTNFNGADLTGADFTGAEVRGADFGSVVVPSTCGKHSLSCTDSSHGYTSGHGISVEQLASTANFAAHDLSGIRFANNYLANANFAGQNLTNARFYGATLAESDLSGADARGALFFGAVLTDALLTNFIDTYGHISGLNLRADQMLAVRDYDGDPYYSFAPPPIMVDQQFAMGPGGTLRMFLEADSWGSTISFASRIPVALGGTLELTFAADVNLASQVGRTFHLFDWTGVSPTGAFTVASPYAWDVSNLYTTGEVTLTSVPEPASFSLLLLVIGAALGIRRCT